MKRAGTALAVAAAILAVMAPGAQATANRPEYQAQVNEICVTANREAERIIGELIRKLIKAEKRGRGDSSVQVVPTAQRKRVAVPLSHKQPGPDPIIRIFRHFEGLLLLVEDSELAHLRQVAPAPGDDALVSDWLNSRALQVALYREAIKIEAKVEKLFERGPGGRRGFKKFFKKLEKLERRYDKIFEQAIVAYDTDIELGARLGASYCITDATGPTG